MPPTSIIAAPPELASENLKADVVARNAPGVEPNVNVGGAAAELATAGAFAGSCTPNVAPFVTFDDAMAWFASEFSKPFVACIDTLSNRGYGLLGRSSANLDVLSNAGGLGTRNGASAPFVSTAMQSSASRKVTFTFGIVVGIEARQQGHCAGVVCFNSHCLAHAKQNE
jgi:hypothetical protein